MVMLVKDIDYCIENSKDAKNISDSKTKAYLIDDLILIKYQCFSKYGHPRLDEENIMVDANKKRSKGVRTPYHYQIKTVIEGDKTICYVLQEKAKGISFKNYCNIKDPELQLKKQEEIVQIPQAHFEKYVSDMCELFGMGLEPQPRNFFYDKNEGFTIIDLSNRETKKIDYDSLKDILELDKLLATVYDCSQVHYYVENEEQKAKSNLLNKQIRLKMFLALEKVIPTFKKFKRDILRSYPKDVVEYFAANKVEVGDLTLTQEEIVDFEKRINEIINNTLRKLALGKCTLEHIAYNEIRIELKANGLQNSWLYHKDNKNAKGYIVDYDYQSSCAEELEDKVKSIFIDKLLNIKDYLDNQNIIDAQNVFKR